MITQTQAQTDAEIVYPDSDGQPMADNTIQFYWITVIQSNLAWLFAQNLNVFVAGDLLWYPVQGNNKLRQAPDVMVVFGVEKKDRGSYQQWKENNIAPQVVFEILSPGNTTTEMNRKLLFYDRYGVEEYYLYDPDRNHFMGWLRSEVFLEEIEGISGWVSPHLGIKFELSSDSLEIYRPNGQPFADYLAVNQELQEVQQELLAERQAKATVQEQLEQERQKAKRLEELLREAGIDLNDR